MSLQDDRTVRETEREANMRDVRVPDSAAASGDPEGVTLFHGWRVAEGDVHEKHPVKGCVWVDVRVQIRCEATGEVRTREKHTLHSLEDGATLDPFYYSEGNESCDCNRALDFFRAGGEPEDDAERPCGFERYKLNLINPVSGEVVYREFEA